MKSLRKISPIEHRLQIRQLQIDCSRANYFEKVRLQMLLGQLFAWFLDRYGIYFFVQRIRIIDDTILFQAHYYKTFYHNKFIKSLQSRNAVLGSQLPWHAATQIGNFSDSEVTALLRKDATFFDNLKYFGSKTLFQRATAIANGDEQTAAIVGSRYSKAVSNSKLHSSLPGLKLFFNQLFAKQLGYKSVVLVKPLYQSFYLNPSLKNEFEKVLMTTKYLRKHEWSFDLLFLAHYGITMADLNYVFALLARQMVNTEVQKPLFKTFFSIMEKFYVMKNNIRGMRLQVKGAWDRHGRTHLFEQAVGDVGLTDYNSLVVYDSIDFITRYGAVTMRFWVHYWSVKKLD